MAEGEGCEGPGQLSPTLPRLVWDAEAARELREGQRLWGALVGTPRDGAGPRLPLLLRPEEVEALRESGEREALDTQEEEEEAANSDSKSPPSSPKAPPSPAPHPSLQRRSRAFRALWGRGLHVTGGRKFGGDFLVYPGPPCRFHALALLLVPPGDARLPLPALVAAARLGTHVRKTLALCQPCRPLAVTSVQWRRDLAQ